MIKECVVLDGKVINIGPWDYKEVDVEVSPAEYDEEGNMVKKAVFEKRITNPFPDGATTEERDFEFDEDRGWYEVGTPALKSKTQQQIDDLTLTLGDLILTGGA